MVNRKEIFIENKLYEVVKLSEYIKNPDIYLQGHVALDVDQDMIYPVVPQNSQQPGIIVKKDAPFMFAKKPETNQEQYSKDAIINYGDAKTYKEFAETHKVVRKLEKDVLTTPDNIFAPAIDLEDSAAMIALKEAVCAKHIDLDAYESRFGSNYNNDKRIFNKNNISLTMLKRMCNALDIKASLTLEDQTLPYGEDVPNPIGKSITIELTSGLVDDE